MNDSPKTREKLVGTAFELFHKQGYSATGVAQILRVAEVNSGSLYHFFPTKEDLLVALLQWSPIIPRLTASQRLLSAIPTEKIGSS